jgi:hypothetical protein
MNLKVSALTISGIILSSGFIFLSPVSSQSFDSIECIKKFTSFYLSEESGFSPSSLLGISREERRQAVRKAEAKCESESRNRTNFDSDIEDRRPRRRRRIRNSNPEAIQKCMNSLLYRTEEQKPFAGWICVPNDVNCKTVRVRTEMSEDTAIQACQGAG